MKKNIVYTLCIFFITSIPLYSMDLKQVEVARNLAHEILFVNSMKTDVSLTTKTENMDVEIVVQFNDTKRRVKATVTNKEDNFFLKIIGLITFFGSNENGVNKNDNELMDKTEKLREFLFIAHKELKPIVEIKKFNNKEEVFSITKEITTNSNKDKKQMIDTK